MREKKENDPAEICLFLYKYKNLKSLKIYSIQPIYYVQKAHIIYTIRVNFCCIKDLSESTASI